MTHIDKPGAYDGVPFEHYHGDCCDAPCLGHSGAREIVEECPAVYFHASAYNPTRPPEEDDTKFDLGTAAHALLLEPEHWEQRAVIIEANDYKTGAAREARIEATLAGKTPLLTKHVEKIVAMRDALLAHPLAGKAFRAGVAERSFFWKDKATGVWLKCRPDFLHPDGTVIHYKTTAASAHPNALQRRAYDHGWFSTVPWYEDGIEAVTGKRPPNSWFIVQEVQPPHLVSVGRMTDRAIDWGMLANRRAIDLFARCLATGKWPGYRETAFEIDLPSFAEFQLEERRQSGEFAPPPALLAAAMEMQRPL
jgi:hypothetical protein